MKIKKYIAPTMPEAMKQIRAELGNEAVILNSKVIHTGGFLGFFKKRSIEVIAAIDPKPKIEPAIKIKEKTIPIQKETSVIQKDYLIPANPKTKSQEKTSNDLIKELAELKDMIKNLPSHNEGINIPYPDPIKEIQQMLISMEINPNYREELLSTLIEKWYKEGANLTKDELLQCVKEILLNKLSAIPHGGISFKKKFVNVIGPTGVGKTTTLAKIAAECVLNHHKKVAFITTDTYRIAAIDQLKTYAKILNVPIEVCYNVDDFRKASIKFIDYDIVLVDTAGRNYRNKQYVDDLSGKMDFKNNIETFLVLSLTAKQKDMEEIFQQFSSIIIDKFIFTKVDETSTYGAMLNLTQKYNIGIAYLTNGQNVPEDILEAKPEVITNILLGVDPHE